MQLSRFATAAAALAASAAAAFRAPIAPEQIHIAYTSAGGSALSVDFVGGAAAGAVHWGASPSALTHSANSSSFNFSTIGWMHQALMDFAGVVPAGARGYYAVEAGGNASAVFAVTPLVANRSERHVVFGDFGLRNDESMRSLIADAAAGEFDSVLHVGDWAYDFEDNHDCGLVSCVGNYFMASIQGYAAIKPTMPVAGNHEACGGCPANPVDPDSKGNFSEYRARMHSVAMHSNSGNNIFYSFERGLVHFLVFSAEAYLYARNAAFLANQLAFMKADLAGVDRARTPWVVALVHKDFTMEGEAFAAFTPILNAGGVDLLFCGHVHYYLRNAPYDSVAGKADSGSVSADTHTYTEPKFLVSIVSGASGNHEDDHKCPPTLSSPVLQCSQNYGYGFFEAVNATTAVWSYKTVRADGPGPANFSDTLTIVQHNHRTSTL